MLAPVVLCYKLAACMVQISFLRNLHGRNYFPNFERGKRIKIFSGNPFRAAGKTSPAQQNGNFMGNLPQYKQVYEALRREISSGEFSAGRSVAFRARVVRPVLRRAADRPKGARPARFGRVHIQTSGERQHCQRRSQGNRHLVDFRVRARPSAARTSRRTSF